MLYMYIHVCTCREEEHLVDMFIIEILVIMVSSLKMSHRDKNAAGNVIELSFSPPPLPFLLLVCIYLSRCNRTVSTSHRPCQ